MCCRVRFSPRHSRLSNTRNKWTSSEESWTAAELKWWHTINKQSIISNRQVIHWIDVHVGIGLSYYHINKRSLPACIVTALVQIEGAVRRSEQLAHNVRVLQEENQRLTQGINVMESREHLRQHAAQRSQGQLQGGGEGSHISAEEIKKERRKYEEMVRTFRDMEVKLEEITLQKVVWYNYAIAWSVDECILARHQSIASSFTHLHICLCKLWDAIYVHVDWLLTPNYHSADGWVREWRLEEASFIFWRSLPSPCESAICWCWYQAPTLLCRQ